MAVSTLVAPNGPRQICPGATPPESEHSPRDRRGSHRSWPPPRRSMALCRRPAGPCVRRTDWIVRPTEDEGREEDAEMRQVPVLHSLCPELEPS